ncbi:MAG: transcription antitermination factor NusB [Candidatus Berkelbacteria bacterium]|nr:transcription antitermination factor NusB [Candidatus Berkelbacteria bacterium]
MNRHLSRMIAMQTLYEWDFREGSDLQEIKERNIEEYEDKCERDFVDILVDGVSKDKVKIDEIIDTSAPEWPVDQISLIDKTVLRIAILELLFLEEIPPKVSINEAVELSKQFGGENSSKFVNGVLGTVYKKYEKEILSKPTTDS